MRFEGCSINCDYCQSFPEKYVCHHKDMIVKKNNMYLFRECVHTYPLFDPTWQLFPCPFMDGEIQLYKKGKKYDTIRVKNGAFIKVE